MAKDNQALIAQLLQWTSIMNDDEIFILNRLVQKSELTADETRYLVTLRKKYLTAV